MSASVPRIAARLDRLALEQLRVIAARQAEEIEELRRQLSYAQDVAESWRDDTLRLMEQLTEQTGCAAGLTLDGHVVAVLPERQSGATS